MAREQLEIPLDDPNELDNTPVEVVIDEKMAKSAPSPDDTEIALNQLRHQLDAERLARYQAEQHALAASQAAHQATSKKADTEVQMVKSAIKTLKRDNKMLRDAYQQALQVGDANEASKINEKMMELKGNLRDLEKGYSPLKKEARQAKETTRIVPQPVAPPQSSHSQLDQIINSVTPRSAAWLKSNRDAIQDQRTINKMFRAHEDAVEDGIEPDSDAYFRFIEGRLGMGQQQQQSESPYSHAAKASERSVSPPAAPVNGSYNSRPGTVTLTRAEADMAASLGMTPKQYAEEKIALQKEGRL